MISYSGLKNYGKATLPSVNDWGTNTNILQDPPKSITTRRIDKVGETNFIIQEQDDSGDRICEAINVYARGVNPSVAVSYSNVGNNGSNFSMGCNPCNTSASQSSTNGNPQRSLCSNLNSKLPYRIMNDGEFRYPILTPTNLLPLSRMVRGVTSTYTKPELIDYSKKMRCPMPAEKTREVYNEILNASIRPTAVYRIEKPLEKPTNCKDAIKPSINVSAKSGIRTMDITSVLNKKPIKEISDHILQVEPNLNMNDSRRYMNISSTNPTHNTKDALTFSATTNLNDNKYINNNEVDAERYIQAPLNSDVNTNLCDSKYVNNNKVDTNIYVKDILNKEVHSNTNSYVKAMDFDRTNSERSIKDKMSVEYYTNKIGQEKTEYIHEPKKFDRKYPQHSAHTNKNSDVYKRPEYKQPTLKEIQTTTFENFQVNQGSEYQGSRNYNLNEKIQPGGFNDSISNSIQTGLQEHSIPQLMSRDDKRSALAKLASEQFHVRH